MNDIKWFYIAIIGVCIGMAVDAAAEHYCKSLEVKSAMENGYEQVESESGLLIWKKSEHTH